MSSSLNKDIIIIIIKKKKKFIHLVIGQRRSRPSSTDLTNMSSTICIKSILTHEQIMIYNYANKHSMADSMHMLM